MNKSYVYILTDNKNKRIKIGLTNDYQNRINNLKKIYKTISLSNSYLIECNNEFAKKLERILHSLFCDYSVILNEKLDGSTEWFDILILDDVLSAVEDMKKYNPNIVKVKKRIKLLKKENNNSKKEKEIKKLEEIVEYRKLNLKNTIKFLKILKTYIKKYKFEIKEKKGFCVLIFYTNGASIKIKDELPLLGFKCYSGSSTFICGVYQKPQKYFEIYLGLNILCSEYKEKRELKDALVLLEKFFKKYFGIDIFSYVDDQIKYLFC